MLNTLMVTLQYFITIMAELVVLFIGISTLIALAFMYIPQDKLKNWLSGKGILESLGRFQSSIYLYGNWRCDWCCHLWIST